MKIGKSKISEKTSGNSKYSTFWAYIPSAIAKDSAFPFRDKEEVVIELKGERLEIRKIYNLSDLTKNYGIEAATLPKLVECKALMNQDMPFLYFNDKVYSYKDVNIISNQIANGLILQIKKLKLKKPNISLLFPNCPETLFCWFAIAKTGSLFVPLSYLLKGDLLEFVLRNSNSEILIIDYKYLINFEEINEKIPKIQKIFIQNAPDDFKYSGKYADFSEILSVNSDNPNTRVNSFDPLEIAYTSGTTGKPKGVVYRNYYTLSGISVGKQLENLGFGENLNKFYCPLPLCQGLERFFLIIPIMYYNGSIVIAENFNISTFWSDVEKHRPDGFCYYGAHLATLVNQAPSKLDRNHSIKYAFGAGALKKIWESFERRFGIQLIEIWSLVEGIGFTINNVGSKGGKLGSIGKPARGVEIKIVDSEGQELPPGRDQIGEICARTRLPFELEYYNLQEETITRKGEDRWVYTGDFGYMDHQGFIYYLGRKSDMIRRGKETFFAVDIEIVANSHPLIIESTVFEVSGNNSLENDLKICAVIRKGASITHKEFQNFLQQNLAYFMVPRYIEFKKELPKNANELIQKFILINEWQSGKSLKNTYDMINNYKELE
ncbi:MAG: AMP-binding protein [Promethearchaeota archaeon]